jgi:hypothetical protein
MQNDGIRSHVPAMLPAIGCLCLARE